MYVGGLAACQCFGALPREVFEHLTGALRIWEQETIVGYGGTVTGGTKQMQGRVSVARPPTDPWRGGADTVVTASLA